MEVQKGRRLIEQEQRRLLHKSPRQQYELALAAGKLIAGAVCKVRDVKPLKSSARMIHILRSLEAEQILVRRPAHQYQLGNRKRKRHVQILWDDCNVACELAARDAADKISRETNFASSQRQRGADRAKQRCFPGTVSAQQANNLARCDGKTYVAQDRVLAKRHADAAEFKSVCVLERRGHPVNTL